jgi:hypothetical protein
VDTESEQVVKAVAGLVDSWRDADNVLTLLGDAGLGSDRVRVIADDPGTAFALAPERPAEVVAGTAGGAGVGTAIGGLMGWFADLVELGALEIEELVAAGPVAGIAEVVDPMIIAGIGLGGVVGGLLGTHAGWSVAEGAAHTYGNEVAHGRLMVLVESLDGPEARHARELLRRSGARHVRIGMSD